MTHRDVAAGVAFVTGHEARDGAELDWEALARFPGTLVFYMGVRALPRIAEGLIGGGRAAGRAGGDRRARDDGRPAHHARDAGHGRASARASARRP